jgi:hypothetical protein
MKRIFTLLSSMILGIAVFAAAPKPKSTLSIKSIDQSDLRVVIDGKRFEPNHHSMMVSNVDAGYHSVKIYRAKNSGFFGKRFEVVYNASVMVKPRTNMLISVDRFGRATVSEQKIRGNRDRDRDWNDRYDDEFDFDRDGKWGDYDDDRRPGNNDRYDRSMNDREFNQVLSSIQKEWFEGNKVKSAQHIISTNFFTSVQVKEMLKLFTFEENKLSLAKMAYAKTVDQRAYLYTVSDVFSFNTSKDDLARFIRNIR